MVVLADKGKGFWCRIHDGRLLTPTTYAALPSSASVAFVAIPFGALALGTVGEGDEEEFLLRDGSTITPWVQVHWEDDTHMTDGNFDDLEEFSDKREDFATLDMTLRYTSAEGNWFVEAFGYNVTDERFQTYLSDQAGAGKPLFAWTRPRSYGLRFAYNFAGF